MRTQQQLKGTEKGPDGQFVSRLSGAKCADRLLASLAKTSQFRTEVAQNTVGVYELMFSIKRERDRTSAAISRVVRIRGCRRFYANRCSCRTNVILKSSLLLILKAGKIKQ